MTSQAVTVKTDRQPTGLYVLFLTEMWERFSYYAMRGILVLYLIKVMQFSETHASKLYGIVTSLIYLSPLIGGYIADKFWGQRRAIIVGGILIALGQFSLAANPTLSFLYAGLFFLVIGNGFFKPNISTIVGELYEENDPRRDAGFTLFYMGINLGAFICNFVAGTLAEKIGFGWGFAAAGFGMIIGLIIFIWGKNKHLQGQGKKPKKLTKEERLEHPNAPLTTAEWQRIAVIFIMAFFSIFFWSAFEQAGASLTIFAEKFTDRVIFGWQMPTSWFQSVNPMFIILFAPLFSKLWINLAKKGLEPSTPAKFVWGFMCLAFGFLILVAASYVIQTTDAKVGIFWLIFAYMFHTMGELCLSPVGLSLVTKLAPIRFASLLMGTWFLANAAANFTAGFYSGYFGHISNIRFFSTLVIMPIVGGLLLLSIKKYVIKWMNGIK